MSYPFFNFLSKGIERISSSKYAALTLTSLCLTTASHGYEAEFKKKVLPVFKEYCIRCHGPEKEEGGIRIDTLTMSLDDHISLEHYQNILDELAIQAMPPEDEKQPSEAHLLEMTSMITKHLQAAKEKHASGGGKPVRRLTKSEYINTIGDLLGVHIAESSLPIDGSIGHFDTDASSLYTTDQHLELYLEAARVGVSKFIQSRNSKPGFKRIEIPLSQDIKRGNFTFSAKAVPPAGYLAVALPFWQRSPNPRNEIYVGPITGDSEEYRVTGSASKPQKIEARFYQPEADVEWGVVESNVPNQQVINGPITKQVTKTLNKFKLTKETYIKAQDLVIKKPVLLSPPEGYQVISPQPYAFFQPILKEFGANPSDAAAPVIISRFTALMNRGRPADNIFVGKLTSIYKQGRQQGMPFWEAINEPLALSMCSIESLFHFEDYTTSKTTGVELANRMSYLLWRSAPDKELLKSGLSGKLLSKTERAAQIGRMIKDEKFDRFLNDFTNQWLELERQNAIAVDKRLYNKFRERLKKSLKQETVEFLSTLIRHNLPIRNMIDSDFMVINNDTAEHYGIPDVNGHEFRIVKKRAQDQKRGGILTHAGILMQTGNGERTSIVERGVFVMRKMLAIEPPPPPPNIDMLPTEGKNFATLTAAELVKLHANTAQCKSCHDKIDPLGVGLEEFDAIGHLRTSEKRINVAANQGKKGKGKKKVDPFFNVKISTQGSLPSGQRFSGIDGLKKALIANKGRLARSFVEALLTYSNGRVAGVADDTIVDAIVERAGKVDYPTRSILQAVLLSDSMISK